MTSGRTTACGSVVLFLATLTAAVAAEPPPPEKNSKVEPLALPGTASTVGFDDMVFSRSLGTLLVPGGGTGSLFLIDPKTLKVKAFAGFGKSGSGARGHDDGSTSADEGRYLLHAIDRTSKSLFLVDSQSGEILARTPLAGKPDYVRFVDPTNEIWVTEPALERIEVFKGGNFNAPAPTRGVSIEVKGGPESLVIDLKRGRAYTNLWKGTTVAIDLAKHAIVDRWPNGCTDSRGLAIDAAKERLFVACAEGRVAVLDLAHGGAIASEARTAGGGVDIIAYDPGTSHLYVPSASQGTLSVFGVSKAGKLSTLDEVKTAKGSHCAVVDDRKQVFVCDPERGRLLLFRDTLPASGP